MKTSAFVCFRFACFLFVVFMATFAKAQSKLIDAKMDWTASGGNSHGVATILLGDETNLASVQIEVGTTPGNYTLFSQQYNVASLPGGASNDADNSTLQIDIGDLATYAHYYVRYRVTLDDSSTQVMELVQ